MASQARINANKRNAQRSTGPKTDAGKARAKLNALKDGTHAKTVSLVTIRWLATVVTRKTVRIL